MLNVAIIEDNIIQAELIVSFINEWSINKKEQIEIHHFSSAEKFCFEFIDYPEINVILLDIQLEKINGIELAKKIRNQKYTEEIIFITAITDYMQEGYEVDALHYLLKPLEKEKLFKCFTKILNKKSKKRPILIIMSKKDKIKIFQDEIIYIESMSHNLKIKTTKKELLNRMNLSKIEQSLDPNLFIKTHRAFIVNINRIRQIHKNFVLMDDSSEIPISRREYKTVNKKFIGLFKKKED